MNKIQLTEQSFNKYAHHHNDEISSSININSKKSREKQRDKQLSNVSKENQSKHMNAIKPYSVPGKQRKISKRDSQKNIPINSPYLPQSNNISGCTNLNQNNSKPKIKKAELSSKNLQQSVNAKNIGDLHSELAIIKAEYKTLKNSYNGLLKHNSDLTQRGEKEANQLFELKKQVERLKREQQKNKSNVRFTQQQIQRIKKQCVRMVQAQKFKNKKLEQTIQQKQLMIAYLRNQLAILNGQSNQINSSFFFQHTAPTYLRNANENAVNLQSIRNNPTSQGNRYLFSQKDMQIQNNVKNMLNIPGSSINLPLSQPTFNSNRFNYPQINKSIINHSAISSIQNSSMIAVSELIDLPKQINQKITKQKDGILLNEEKNKYLIQSDVKKMQERESFRMGIEQNKNKRQYIFSNQDDSLSFSYQKSKQSIYQNQHDSIQSLNDPTILTFTKKDVYVLNGDQQDGQNQNNQQHNCSFSQELQEQNKSSIIIIDKSDRSKIMQKRKQMKSKINQQSVIGSDYVNQSDESNEQQNGETQQKISYTGQQQLMTFQNRGVEKNIHENLFKIMKPHIKQRQYKKQKIETKQKKRKQKQKQKIIYLRQGTQQKKQVTSKSKLHTKRLQILVDQMNGHNDGKQSSAQTKKRHINHDINNSKTGKKKLSKKRKSQQCGGSLIKK